MVTSRIEKTHFAPGIRVAPLCPARERGGALRTPPVYTLRSVPWIFVSSLTEDIVLDVRPLRGAVLRDHDLPATLATVPASSNGTGDTKLVHPSASRKRS